MSSAVSHSKVDSYLLCRRKNFYGYTQRLQRIDSSSGLAIGSVGHQILEAFYSHILSVGIQFKDQRDAVPEAIEKARAVADELIPSVDVPTNRYPIEEMLFDWYFPNEPVIGGGYRVLAVEKEFSIEYDEGKAYPFVVDLIVQDAAGRTYVLDHKFVWDFYSSDEISLMPQLPKYIGALRGLNYKIDGGMYNMIRTRKKKEPTVADVVYMTGPLDIPAGRVKRTFIEQVQVAREIDALSQLPEEQQDVLSYRTSNALVCSRCSFKSLCSAELNGKNVALIKKTEYKLKEEREAIAISKEKEGDD